MQLYQSIKGMLNFYFYSSQKNSLSNKCTTLTT